MNAPFPLREAHCHIAPFGASLSLPSLSACASLGEMLERVRADAARLPAGGAIRSLHARHQAWPEQRWPTMSELDAAAAGRAVVVMSFDHHEAVASSAALAKAGVTAGQRIGEKGLVQSDAQGQATGLLIEDAAYVVWNALASDQAGIETVMRDTLAALRHYAAMGFAEVHDLRTEPVFARALLDLDATGELTTLGVRVAMFPLIEHLQEVDAMTRAARAKRVTLAGGKLFVDGTLNARTAATLEPCTDPLPGEPLGRMMVTAAQIDDAVRACDSIGLPLATHAIGDRAVREVLDSHERVRPRARGQRIEHCELVHPRDVPRFVEMGITASVQPCHLLADVPALTRLHPHALERVLPLRSLLTSGLKPGRLDAGLVFGSDAPIVRPEPEDSIIAAMTLGDGFASLNPGEAIDDATAWSCFAIA